jgi:Xaa-Pro aminopeptidase
MTNQLTPIDYRDRLARLMSELGDGALLHVAPPPAIRNNTVEHTWRQESFLHYLTGFSEPEAAILVLPFKPEGQRVLLFLREKDPQAELWDGPRLGVAKAKATLAVDDALPISTLWDRLPDLLGDAARLYYALGLSAEADRKLIHALGQHKARHGKRNLSCKLPVFDALGVAGRLRLHKEPAEVERLRGAAAITRRAFAKVYATVAPGMSENQVHGLILGEFIAAGADMEAYGSIVAGGRNACVLHYRDNNGPLRDGELLLIDAGAQFQYYASDVTRTFPIGKRFSGEQKAVYEVVLEAQRRALGVAVPGSTLTALHKEAVQTIAEGLKHLGLAAGSADEIVETGAVRRYFPHGTSHWIGMDVHDVGVYSDGGQPVALEPGMYFSVEPGLYVDPGDERAPPGFRGIGVRIEDDCLITATGHEVVTAGIAKDVSELENRF